MIVVIMVKYDFGVVFMYLVDIVLILHLFISVTVVLWIIALYCYANFDDPSLVSN